MIGGKAGVVVRMADDLKRHRVDSSASFRLDQAGAWLREPSKLVHIGLSIKSRQGGALDQPSPLATAARPFAVTNRSVLAIAVPMTLAYLTTPLLGLVDTAVVGQFGDAALLGGLAAGAMVFDVVFTTFNFLRSGTTGLVAQAFGRGDAAEEQAVFWRALPIAVVAGIAACRACAALRRCRRNGSWAPSRASSRRWTPTSASGCSARLSR